MSEQENPYQSPEPFGEHREKCKSQFRTTQADEGSNGDLFYYRPWSKPVVFGWILFIVYLMLAVEYPLKIWGTQYEFW
jgi:hypothetical protein